MASDSASSTFFASSIFSISCTWTEAASRRSHLSTRSLSELRTASARAASASRRRATSARREAASDSSSMAGPRWD